jgi:uncharacterized protein (TIGR03790 family)
VSPSIAQDGTNVLVVVNDASAESQQIAGRYVAARRIPADNIVHVRTSVADEIDRLRFGAEIERPLTAWLARHSAQDRILFIVLTKGIPLRVTGTVGLTGTVASVDSELTLLYRKMAGRTEPVGGRVANPYYHGDKAVTDAAKFTHRLYDIYLVTRLDGFTVADVYQLIDRGVAPVKDGVFVLDQKANIVGDRTGDAWLAAALEKMPPAFAGRTVLESSPRVASATQVLGYYSWGSNDSAVKQRRPDVSFVPGALAGMFVSTDGRTFQEPPESWVIGTWSDSKTHFRGSPQSLSGDLIRQGATGVAGHVAEPYLDATARPQILFPAYVNGFNLAESFYLAVPYLSWQTIVVGDPLCAPFSARTLARDEIAPEMDSETEFPKYFAQRRLERLVGAVDAAATAKLILKGESRLARDDHAGAETAFMEAAAREPRLVSVQLALASLYEEIKEYDRAIERYRNLLAEQPNDFIALNNLAYTLAVHKGLAVEALPLAARAYTLSPKSAQIADTVGWIHFLLRNYLDAERFLTEATKLAPSEARFKLQLARVYLSTGQRQRAEIELKKVVELQPSWDVDEEMRKLREVLAQPPESLPNKFQ